MLVKTYGSAVIGVDAMRITIEVNVSPGVQTFLVGLPDNAVRESQQRIMSAFEQNGFRMPGRKIVVNMAPAGIRKVGSYYDLPIAVGILAASEQMAPFELEKYVIMGELSLDGALLPIKGALPMAVQARSEGFEGFILPRDNAREAAVVDRLKVYGMDSLQQVIDFLNGTSNPQPEQMDTREDYLQRMDCFDTDFADVKGQQAVKRALEVAAAGGHNILMIGPPGSGKTMLAKRLPTIMPPMTMAEALETTKIHSVAGKTGTHGGLLSVRPFRSPHHTASAVALVGGGIHPQPGEISLAHNGLLFLDEFPEFSRSILDVLRQPLEDRKIHITRAQYAVEYPCSFLLVASMNPCPCGHYTDPAKECSCGMGMIQRYLNKISGPLLDRIDLHIEVLPVPFSELTEPGVQESSETIRARVTRAREIQTRRLKQDAVHCNAMMTSSQLKKYCTPDQEGIRLLQKAMEQMGLSARAYDRILKMSRTIADLAGARCIGPSHIAEAVQYRSLDRQVWTGR